jgi:2-oxoglutarate/2-oxoacid ferredoxin oxidoreductase subunit beta
MISPLPSPASELVLSRVEGAFPVFYQSDRPTKNALEKKWIDNTREKVGNASDLELLRKTFDRMK